MNISALFRANGLKVTPQRRVVYNVLSQLCHASVEQIVDEVTRIAPDISVATVYNVLDCFASNHIISRLSTPLGKLFYDITPTDHHHIITQEQSIVDYSSDDLNSLLREYFKQFPIPDQQIERMTLQIYTKQNSLTI